MRIFRKRKKFGNFGGVPGDGEPIPDIVYQIGAEQAAQYAASRSRPQSPYAARRGSGQEDIYGYPRVLSEEDLGYQIVGDDFVEKPPKSSPLNFIGSLFGISRSSSRERYANRRMDNIVRPGSPAHFNQLPPGTPIKYRRRAASPEFLQARVPSPLHFAQQPQLGSPDVARRYHRAQVSQDIQQLERQQRQQQEMMMLNQLQCGPQYQQIQQPYFEAYPMIQQPQIYSYY